MFKRISSNSAYLHTKYVISFAEFPDAVKDIENEKFYRVGYRCYALRLAYSSHHAARTKYYNLRQMK